MPFLKYTSVSRTAARALEEFSDEFRTALALVEPDLWAARLGLVLSTNALKTTFPIPLDAVGYKEFKGDIKYRSLYSRALSMTTKKWSDGVEELAEVIENDQFIGWQDQPAAMAVEWMRHPNVLVAQTLQANPVLDFYRDPDTNTAGSTTLFHASHPENVLIGSGTFDNDRETTRAAVQNGEFFKAASEYYAGINGPNGRPLGLQMAGGAVLTNLAEAELFRDVLSQDTLIRAVQNDGTINGSGTFVGAVTQQNRFKGTVSHDVAMELTTADVFYTVAGGAPNAHPFVVMQGSTPEEIVMDKTSDKYKEHLKVSLAYVGDANVAAALPHKICRWTFTA